MPALRTLCDRYGLALIEDSCQAPLTPVGGRTTGAFGDFSVYAFCDRKHVRSGDGGMVLCQDSAVANRLRSLVNFGKGQGRDEYEEVGFSYRMGLRAVPTSVNGSPPSTSGGGERTHTCR